MMILWNRCFVVAAVLAASLVAGCDSDNKDNKPRDRDRIARRDRQRSRDRLDDRSPDPVIGRDRDRDRTGRRTGMDEIPAAAQAVDTGTGSRLEYEPTRDGVIYVYDTDSDQVIYVGRIRDREQFRLDPDSGRAQVNTRTVFRSDMNPRHRYRLYFEPSR